MSEIISLVFVVAIILFITIINESAIALFKLKNPKTRFWIYVVSFLACFSIFLFVPLKYIYPIIYINEVSFENRIYTIKPDSIAFATSYTNFAALSLAMAMISLLFFFAFITLDRFYIERRQEMRPCKSRKIRAIVSSLEKEFGVRVLRVSLFGGDSNAFVYGVPPSLAISDRLVKNLDSDELRIVLRHEFCHIKSGDTLLRPFLLSLCFFFFYNPAIYFIYKRIMEQREYIADKKAISNLQDKKRFLALLLKVQGYGTPAACGFASKTTRRVDTLLSDESHRWIPLFLSFILTASMLGMCNFFLNGQEETVLDIPSLGYYTRTMVNRDEVFEEKMRRKEKFEFYIPEDISLLEVLKSSGTEIKRRIVIRDWNYENSYRASVFRFTVDYDSEGNPLLHVSDVEKTLLKEDIFERKMERMEKLEILASGDSVKQSAGGDESDIWAKKWGHRFPNASALGLFMIDNGETPLLNSCTIEGL